MRLLLDSTLCQAYGLCREQVPDHIELDDWGYAEILASDVPPERAAAARAAVEACPNRALRLEK